MRTDHTLYVGPYGKAALAALLVALAASGCQPRMKMLTDRTYPPTSPLQQIELYQGDVLTPYEEIAILDSIKVEALTSETQKVLVNDLRERARRLGADAVIHVSMLIAPDRNFVLDPQTPFRSYRQGWTDLYFLRGKAIRYRPALMETDSDTGGELSFAEGERPDLKPQSPPELEVRESRDAAGRTVWTAKRKEIRPKLPTVDEGR
ncbi:MAG: hypothetical protein N3D11_01000 [Candidatus Sumerlaeia bacterium]|nr:hypothetical protein [Candidatus Sumerlaeia bacterium]